MFGLRRRRRLLQARNEYLRAAAEWDAAEDRQDTRRMHAARGRLQRANAELLAAEAAALPKPAHLSTPQGA